MKKFREWLSPLVFFSNNWISLAGVVVVTTAAVAWLVFLPGTLIFVTVLAFNLLGNAVRDAFDPRLR